MEKEAESRLVKHLAFLESELEDYPRFKSLSWEAYNMDRDRRRNVERWVENIVNSTVDIAKIILRAENQSLPDTYREILLSLALVPGFKRENLESVAERVRLRNIVAHQYLDLKWEAIKKFIQETEPFYQKFLQEAKDYLKQKI